MNEWQETKIGEIQVIGIMLIPGTRNKNIQNPEIKSDVPRILKKQRSICFIWNGMTHLSMSLVVTPEIDELGRIDIWPKVFFDEADIQLEKLL